MAEETRDGEEPADERRLRHALYRPDASALEVERYRRHLEQEAASSAAGPTDVPGPQVAAVVPEPPGRAPVRRRTALLIAAAIVVVLVAGAGIRFSGVGRSADLSASGRRPIASSDTGASPQPRRAVPVARDSGSREFATGPATVVHAGTYRYTITSGDTELGIAARFHVCVSDVTGGLPLAMQGNYLEPGTTITLALASTSVWPDRTVHCTDS